MIKLYSLICLVGKETVKDVVGIVQYYSRPNTAAGFRVPKVTVLGG